MARRRLPLVGMLACVFGFVRLIAERNVHRISSSDLLSGD
jgi:hypothetical protein